MTVRDTHYKATDGFPVVKGVAMPYNEIRSIYVRLSYF